MADPVVLLPGLQSDHRSWVFQIPHLEKRFPVLVPSGYHCCRSIAEMADCVQAQLPSRFHMVAWSMGGYITLQMLPAIRQRLVSLVFMATSARPEDPEATHRRRAAIALAEREGMAAANGQTLAFSCLDVEALETAAREGVRRSAVELGFAAYRAQQNAIINRPDGRDNLAFVSCPTLVVVGDHDAVTPPDRAREIHLRIPDSQFVEIANCGHCPPLEQPGRINALLDSWLDSADA